MIEDEPQIFDSSLRRQEDEAEAARDLASRYGLEYVDVNQFPQARRRRPA